MTRYVLGVDAGGTKTLAAIADEAGVLLGSGRGGPGNFDDVGIERARANIGEAVEAARRAAGLAPEPFAAAFLGVAGVVSEADRAVVRAMAADLALAPDGRVGVDHDCRIALAGGLSGRPGIVLIIGTGSSCFGMNAAGEAWRSGGWGHLISDEGSGYWLGVEALRAAVRAWDGRERPTVLLGRLLQHLGVAEPDDLLHRLYVVGMSRAELAALAPLVIAAAREGDAVAGGLLARGAEELADTVLAVARRLGLYGQACELALAGGLAQVEDFVVQPLRAAVQARLPGCRVMAAELPPALGACLLALRLLEVAPSPAISRALREGAALSLET